MATNYNFSIVRNGLILYLDASNSKSFVSGSTTWTDISRNGRIGSLINNPAFVQGSPSYFNFGGTNEQIRVGPVTSNFSNNLTYSIWYYGTTFSGTLFWDDDSQSGQDSWVSISSSGQFISNRDPDGFKVMTSVGAATPGVWCNFVFVSRSTAPNKIFYINGQFDTSNNTAITSRSGRSYLTLGYNYDGFNTIAGGSPLRGRIGMFSVYGRSLSASEVLQNYNAIKKRFGL